MNRLLELRKKRNLTQKDIALYLNLSRQGYANYELGVREMGYDVLSRLAEYFHVSIDYLLGRTDVVGLSPFDELDSRENSLVDLDVPAVTLNLGETELLRYYQNLDDKKRLMLIDFARKLYEL